MIAEEAIDIIERAAEAYPNMDLVHFRDKVRNDLVLFRSRDEIPFEYEHPDMRGDAIPPKPQQAFRVPEKYSKTSELWIVFSSFYACFVDPISIGADIVSMLSKLPIKERAMRLIFAGTDAEGQDDEVLEIEDLYALQGAAKELHTLASNVGQVILGDAFSIEDFEEERGDENE